MPNLYQRKSFLFTLLCLAFVNCSNSKKDPNISFAEDIKVTDSTLKNTSELAKEDPKKPAEDDNKKTDVPATPNDQNIITNNQLSFITNNTSAKPTTITTSTVKKTTSPIAEPTVKPAVVPPKDMAGKRTAIERKDLDQLLASPKLSAPEKALVQEYINLINSPTGVTRDQTGSMFTLMDKMNNVAAPDSASKTTTTTEITTPSLNEYKDSGMLEVFDQFADPKLGINQLGFDHNKIHELLTKDEILNQAERDYLIKKYFEVLENNNPNFLEKLPMHDRMVKIVNMCFVLSDFMTAMTKKFETAEQMKTVKSELDKKMVSALLYGFSLNQKLNPNASKRTPKEQVISYTSEAEVINPDTKKKTRQRHRILSLGRFDFSDPNKTSLTADDIAFAKDVQMIWSAVEDTKFGSFINIKLTGNTNKTGDDATDITTANNLASIVKSATQLNFNQVS